MSRGKLSAATSRLQGWAGRPIAAQFSRFLLVGALATVVHYAVLATLVEALGVHPVVATSIGFCCGVIVSYVCNRRFTFAQSAARGGAFLRFAAVALVGLILNAAIVALLMRAGLAYILAQLLATGLVVFWNFFGARLFVFDLAREGRN